jgi:hypothetical protein
MKPPSAAGRQNIINRPFGGSITPVGRWQTKYNQQALWGFHNPRRPLAGKAE